MKFEEFSRYREEFKCDWQGNLLSIFEELLQQPQPEDLDLSRDDRATLNDLQSESDMIGDGYLRWVAQLYGREIIEVFGSLKIVDSGLLPIGMVNLFRSGRVQWKG